MYDDSIFLKRYFNLKKSFITIQISFLNRCGIITIIVLKKNKYIFTNIKEFDKI